MKRNALAVLMALTLLAAGCGNAGQPMDFRGVNWGSTRKAVEKSEPLETTFVTDDVIMYETTILDTEAEIDYVFADDRLVEARVVLLAGGTLTIDEMIERFHTYAADLTALYGDPLNTDCEHWLNPDPEYAGDSVAHQIYYERLELLYEWRTETTHHTLTLNCISERINLIHHAVPLQA